MMNLFSQKGFIALITILIISAICVMVGLTLTLESITEMKMSLEEVWGSQAYYLANYCVEEALMKLKEDDSYRGDEIINIDEGNCHILPIEGNWIIKVIANVANHTKKLKVVVSEIYPEMVIDSWEEVSEF